MLQHMKGYDVPAELEQRQESLCMSTAAETGWFKTQQNKNKTKKTLSFSSIVKMKSTLAQRAHCSL